MHPNATLIDTFYGAFRRRDPHAMAACYGPGIRFQDPVFTLEGPRVAAMWRMLCERGKDLRVEWSDVRTDDRSGSAAWEAWYTFSATRRPVHNRIRAEFVFDGGRIVQHTDQFDLYRWARQALGLPGVLFGWSPPMQNVIRRNAAKALDAYVASHG